MAAPLQITFRNMGRSPAIEADVRKHAGKLGKLFDRIVRCEVAVEALHRHHRQGNHYHVRIHLAVPGEDLVSSRQPDGHHAYTDVYVAIRDAFRSLRRQIEDRARARRGAIKARAAPDGRTV